MKRLRSGRLMSASTTLRSIRRKSPASLGTSKRSEAFEQAVEELAADCLKRLSSRARLAHRVHHLGAGHPLGDHGVWSSGRMLQVAVEQHHRVAGARPQGRR
jgi:hypothetical protein